MLYYSGYKQSDNQVTLMAIDVIGGSKVCYELGTFNEGVQPVAGLMELGEIENHIDWILGNQTAETMVPTAVAEKAEPKGTRAEASGGSPVSFTAPMSVGEVKNELVYVDVTLPEAGTNADMTVSFDPTKLVLEDVGGITTAFAWSAENGQIRFSLADDGRIPMTQTVARLTFRSIAAGETTISVTTDWLSADACGQKEEITLTLKWEPPHVHEYKTTVTLPTCTEEGYTTHTCSCGDSYISDKTAHQGHSAGKPVRENVVEATCTEDGSYDEVTGCTVCCEELSRKSVALDALGHDWQGTACGRCGEPRKIPFTDVPEDSFYHDAVLWAVENGITTGVSPTSFAPNTICNRAQVVTFLYRAMEK